MMMIEVMMLAAKRVDNITSFYKKEKQRREGEGEEDREEEGEGEGDRERDFCIEDNILDASRIIFCIY